MEIFIETTAREMQVQPMQVKQTIELLEAGNTVPFITRYRKEMTGGLNEDQIRAIEERVIHYRALEERKATVLEQIKSQGKLTQELENKIRQTDKLKELEDLYLPFKPKKRTLATIAREKGLEPFAMQVWAQTLDDAAFHAQAAALVDAGKELNVADDVIIGVGHILAEMISENADIRQELRPVFQQKGVIQVKPTAEEEPKKETSEYANYFTFSQDASAIPPHRVLAINRGEKEKALKVTVTVPETEIFPLMEKRLVRTTQPKQREFFVAVIHDSYERLIYPSLCRELRNDMSDLAEQHAIKVFGENLRKLLLVPPVRGKKVLGIDPGIRTGCKLAVLDELGKMLEVGVMFPEQRKEDAASRVLSLIRQYGLELIVIGNGTACRETEEFVSELIAANNLNLEYIIVNEAGASVYSASKEAQQEFPDLDASYRGTISIARRLQDPLAELVKIDPKSVGVGLYQHDVKPKELSKMVDTVVESCVNYVGVDLNTASVSLLKYVSGLNETKAKNVYEWRLKNDGFKSRQELLEIKGIGPATFVQAAGFLRIPGGGDPLDNTQIHPESYDKARLLLQKSGIDITTLSDPAVRANLNQWLDTVPLAKLAVELEIGEPTLRDIIDNLKKPGRDPRDELPKPFFRKGVLNLEDLTVGMDLKGTVRNVVDFGAFVDIGVHEDGLVHVSELADRFVQNPHDVVAVGDIVNVRVISVDLARHRVALTMRTKDRTAPHAQGDAGRSASNEQHGDNNRREQKPFRPAGEDRRGHTSASGERRSDAGKNKNRPQREEPAKPAVFEDWKKALMAASQKGDNKK